MRHGGTGKKKPIKFMIVETGAPAPHECWCRIMGANGRIMWSSELMSKRNARRSLDSLITSVKGGRYNIVEQLGTEQDIMKAR